MKRLSKVNTEWSPSFAYAIGLIATDGNLSKDGRHINLTSKDEEMILTFKRCLSITNKIGLKTRGGSKIKKYFQVQFGDKNFYEFLLSLGLMPAKSKTIGALKIPEEYFADFLRGCIDGDGNIDMHYHPESKHPQLKVRLCSASNNFLFWMKSTISQIIELRGGWIENGRNIFILNYGKADSIKLLGYIYYVGVESYLERKYSLAQKFLGE